MAALSSFGFSSNLEKGFGYAGAAVQDLFASQGAALTAAGARAAAAGYRKAAGLATENLGYEEKSVALKQLQTDRSLFQTISSAEANAAGNGLKLSGSALGIIMDSANQGQLTKDIISQQGLIDANAIRQQIASYTAQAQQYDAAASAADMSGIGSIFGTALKGISAIAQFAMFSDRRLKTNIELLGKAANGLSIYRYDFLEGWGGKGEIGFMADEVELLHPEAVSVHESGFKMVNYEMAVR